VLKTGAVDAEATVVRAAPPVTPPVTALTEGPTALELLVVPLDVPGGTPPPGAKGAEPETETDEDAEATAVRTTPPDTAPVTALTECPAALELLDVPPDVPGGSPPPGATGADLLGLLLLLELPDEGGPPDEGGGRVPARAATSGGGGMRTGRLVD
jgi:hypothetical protein